MPQSGEMPPTGLAPALVSDTVRFAMSHTTYFASVPTGFSAAKHSEFHLLPITEMMLHKMCSSPQTATTPCTAELNVSTT